jgi:hypothetical protein
MKTTHVALFMSMTLFAPTLAIHAQGPDPCALLTAADVQKAFPGSKAGQLDRTLEKNGGILRCKWDNPTGWLLVISGADAPEDTPQEEAETLAVAFIDPVRGNLKRSVRFESLPGVGDQAIAVVERRDEAKGILQDGALMVVRRGNRQVVVIAQGLARSRERVEALRVLGELGKVVAKKLG